jgi:translation initiation factor 2 subunit 1
MEGEPEHPKHNPSGVNLNYRFYSQQYPRENELVVVKVKHVADMGAYVTLLEYNKIEGMIMLTELSRKRIRSVSKLTRVGRQEVVMVLRVDANKGYIDLSKKRVAADDIAECEKRFTKSKTVNSILRHVAEMTRTDIEVLYEAIVWPLYERFEHALDAMRMAVTDPTAAFAGIEMTPETREQLIKVIRNRLTPKRLKIRADFVVTCYDFEGVEAIRTAIQAGLKTSTDKAEIDIRLIAAPLYGLVMTTDDRSQGLVLANECLRRIREEIIAHNGNFAIKTQPQVIGDNDDLDLEEIIAKQRELNQKPEELVEDNFEGIDVDVGVGESVEVEGSDEEEETKTE